MTTRPRTTRRSRSRPDDRARRRRSRVGRGGGGAWRSSASDSSSSRSIGPLRWNGACPDPSACDLDYAVVVANTTNVRATATIRFDGRLVFPLSVPAPDGAALTVAVDPVTGQGDTVSAATAG